MTFISKEIPFFVKNEKFLAVSAGNVQYEKFRKLDLKHILIMLMIMVMVDPFSKHVINS
jgi:hypothetical protein